MYLYIINALILTANHVSGKEKNSGQKREKLKGSWHRDTRIKHLSQNRTLKRTICDRARFITVPEKWEREERICTKLMWKFWMKMATRKINQQTSYS